MPNGPFTSYKRKRTKKKKGSRVERTKCCRTDFGASLSVLALCFLLHRFLLQGFEESRAVSRIVRVRPAAPPTCFPVLCVEASRDLHLSAALFAIRSPLFIVIIPCPIAGCNTSICYLLAFISIYSLVCACLCRCPYAFSVLWGRVPV